MLFPSGRFIRLNVDTQISLTLQSIGEDFKNAKGLCGNMDGMKENDAYNILVPFDSRYIFDHELASIAVLIFDM